jgi:cell division protein FtsB
MKQSIQQARSDSSSDIAICYLDKSSARQHQTLEQEQRLAATGRIEELAERNEELTDRIEELPANRDSREVTTI